MVRTPTLDTDVDQPDNHNTCYSVYVQYIVIRMCCGNAKNPNSSLSHAPCFSSLPPKRPKNYAQHSHPHHLVIPEPRTTRAPPSASKCSFLQARWSQQSGQANAYPW
ncbi:hypothetical protein I7I53_08707 [Histoplasma capsulatum var. duboisii H88]|nr:hypothetical protein I7I53_08707 [Histoplasma capsulatum var. duboisii H88]